MCVWGGGGQFQMRKTEKKKNLSVLVRGVGSLPDVLSVDNNIFKQYP